MFLVKGVLYICSKVTEEHPCRSVISIKLLYKITLRHDCSPVNLLYIFRIPFCKNTSGWLLLYIYDPHNFWGVNLWSFAFFLKRSLLEPILVECHIPIPPEKKFSDVFRGYRNVTLYFVSMFVNKYFSYQKHTYPNKDNNMCIFKVVIIIIIIIMNKE